MDADAKRLGGGGRLNADNGSRGEKLAKSCGRLLWMTPYRIYIQAMYNIDYYYIIYIINIITIHRLQE